MARFRDPDRRLPDPDTWDLPRRLNPDDCRTETGAPDCDRTRFEDEDER